MNRTFFDKKEPNIMLMHENSQLLLENKFQFIHPYDMEPCRDIITFVDGIDWTYVPFEDEEWNYMINRQEYLLDLCLSFDITRDSIYLQKGKELLLDWITQNQTSENWRTIDTGIRLMYWEMMIQYLEEGSMLTASESEKIVHSIEQQISYLDDHYIDKYDLSNWGVLIVTGFFIMSKRIGIRQESGMYQRMLNRLTNQLRLQIQPSGNHWEQSPLYFMEVLRSIVCIHQSQVLRDEPVQKLLEEKILSMYHFMPHFVTPEGTTILQGDTDEMRVDDVVQTISLIYKQSLSVLFGESVSVDYMMLYFSQKKLNIKTWKKEIENNINENSVTSMIDDYTGNYYFRSDWSSFASYCHLYNGPLGSGHGHLSLGHVDLSLRGDNLFVDSGRLTYVESPLRYLLKEVPQHNTVVINGHPFGNVINSWGYSEVPTSLANHSYEDSYFWSVRSMYLDNQLYGTFKVVRTVLYLKELDSFVILDQIVSIGNSHFSEMTRYFNLNPHLDVIQNKSSVDLVTEEKSYYVHFSENSISVEDGFYAPTYNSLIVNKKIVTQGNNTTQYVVLTPQKNVDVTEVSIHKTDNGSFSEEQCYGLALETNGEKWLIYSMIEDTYSGHKLYKVDNQFVYGQFGVIHLKEGEENKYTRIF